MKTPVKLAAIYMLIGSTLFVFTGVMLTRLNSKVREYRKFSTASSNSSTASLNPAQSDDTSPFNVDTGKTTVEGIGVEEELDSNEQLSKTENDCGFVTKVFGKQSVLINQDGSQINVRIRPDINSTAMNAGNPNDFVDVLDEALDDKGCQWVQVQFGSGEIGWIRADFLNADYRD